MLKKHATFRCVVFRVAVDGELFTVWQPVMFSVSDLLA